MHDDLPLFTAARRSDPATSQANKNAFRTKATQRDVLLATYVSGACTDEEAGKRTFWRGASMFDARICYWKRCSELRKLGYIVPTGATRTSDAGQQQQVCEITGDGAAYVDEMRRHGVI